MANTLKIKNSNVALRVPTSLEDGELAINFRDGKLFFKDSNNEIKHFNSDVLENALVNQTKLLNYKYSTLNDLKDQQIAMYQEAIPPYVHNFKHLSEGVYYPQADNFINNVNINSIEKIDVGEYKFHFISVFSSNTYYGEVEVKKFDNFGESPNFAIVSEKANNYAVVKTGRTNINDINIIDRFDISQFKIKFFE